MCHPIPRQERCASGAADMVNPATGLSLDDMQASLALRFCFHSSKLLKPIRNVENLEGVLEAEGLRTQKTLLPLVIG